MGIIKKGIIKQEGVIYLEDRGYAAKKPAESKVMPLRPSHETQPQAQIEYKAPEIKLPEISVSVDEEIESVRTKTQQMIEEANTESQNIIDQAVSESEKIREDAKMAGVEEAKREAEENASDKVKEAVATLNEAVKERKKIIKDAEAEILRLSLKVAEQITRSEVSLHKDVCLNIVSEAIGRVSDREQIIIKVNRDDLEHIKKYKDKISGLADGVKSLSIIEDAGVEPGGCIIETNLGYVDARISTKIKAIEEAFQKVR